MNQLLINPEALGTSVPIQSLRCPLGVGATKITRIRNTITLSWTTRKGGGAI